MKQDILIVLILILILGMSGCSDPRDNILWSVNYEEGKSLPAEAEEAVKDFLLDSYYYMATWEEETDLTPHFETPESEQALVCQEAFNLLIEMRSKRDVDLKFECKEIKVAVKDVAKNGDTYTVDFEEDYIIRFPFMEDDSITQGVECRMGIKETDGKYKLTFYERDEDFYRMIHEEYKYGSDTPAEDLTALTDKVMKEYRKQLDVLTKDRDKKTKKKACTVAYDRDSAKEYALQYALERNPEWFAYDSLGGNCQNFGSQVLRAGGIPMDISGGATWKHYSTGVNLNNTAEGRTPSWTGVPFFYFYAKNNSGYGLVATVDANVYTAEAGDIMQVGNPEGEFTHTIVSLGPITDEEGNVIDIVTVSNTMDRKNYPLSAYNCPFVRLIKVHGYNK